LQPEHVWGVELDTDSHRPLDIYNNAMLVIALNDYIELLRGEARSQRWGAMRDDLQRNIRQHLWDARRQKFGPHVHLDKSPSPQDFDETAVLYHGGTAVAIEAGLLAREEIRASLAQMSNSSFGLSVRRCAT
jgi:hypothetical protein